VLDQRPLDPARPRIELDAAEADLEVGRADKGEGGANEVGGGRVGAARSGAAVWAKAGPRRLRTRYPSDSASRAKIASISASG